MKIKFIILQFVLSIFCQTTYASEKPLTEQIAIEVKKQSREFAYTNKETAFYYGETNGENKSAWQGLNVFAKKFLDDYLISIDGVILTKQETRLATVYPYQLQRIYKNGTVEIVTLLDSLPALIVELKFPATSKIKISPVFSDIHSQSECSIEKSIGTLLIARNNHLQKTEKENYPVWLGIGVDRPTAIVNDEYKNGINYSPSSLVSDTSITSLKIAFVVGDKKKDVAEMVKYVLDNSSSLIEKRKNRMEKLLHDTEFKSGNKRFDHALMWAKISMDALIMNQITKGIFAGLPWFNNYWGRDSFISLSGATLVNGSFEEAKKILLSFAEYQEKDYTNSNYGRIPNIVTTTHKSYNTADGTPRFVIAALDYYRYSGDIEFVKKIFPVIEKSVEGTLKFHTDKKYFLVHEDAETWMDAVGPDGPWSPRGNRANDIQSLWYQQLTSAVEFAKLIDNNKFADKWLKIALQLKKNFQHEFISSGRDFIYDHLNVDGKKDLQIRPNQIFCSPILNDETRARVLKKVVSDITYIHGVGSLSSYDKNFHPYHQYQPYYVKDAAYHNGVVWTWLGGPVISELCMFDKADLAFGLTDNLVHQILDRGSVGTLSELLDAVPRVGENEPDLSGTFSQAWSLAEFIRNLYQDYIGVKFEFNRGRVLKIIPNIPKELGNVEARINFGDESIKYSVKDGNQFRFFGDKLKKGIKVELDIGKNANVTHIKTNLEPQKELIAYMDTLGNVHTVPDDMDIKVSVKNKYPEYLSDLKFAVPLMLNDYPVLHKQKHKLLDNSQIKKINPLAKVLCEVSDPVGDDNGNGHYSYPLNSNFVEGIFDITNFKVSYDDENIYFVLKFRKLIDPGWHPEYGSQLTFAAIVIRENENTRNDNRSVGMNSKYQSDKTFSKIIYVGGGVRLDDKDGKILAEYIPVEGDSKTPLGDVSSATVSFSFPREYIGNPNNKWKFTILIGGQDDHGGAGIGEFRSVEKERSEWTGGGKEKYDDPNVYDILTTE